MGINRGTVLDLINDVHRAGGFKDYNSYSYLFDQVDTMPESKENTEPHWIPVTEEPIPDGEYLVTWTSEIQEKPILSIICRYSGVWDCWELQMLGHQDINVLAYMELPEAYKPTVPPECEGDCGWCKPTVIEKCKGVTT